MKEKKEKPQYSLWQNTKYIAKLAWERDKVVLMIMPIQVILSVAVSLLYLYLPKTVIAQITSSVEAKTLIFTIIGYTVLITAFAAIEKFYWATVWLRRCGLRLLVTDDIVHKVTTTDFANLELEDFNNKKQKAIEQTWNNSASTEAIYGSYVSIGINVLGFIIYLLLLATINPIILIITGATTIIGYFVRNWANRWEFEQEKASAEFGKRLWFLEDLGSQNKYAKDIRLFAMYGWINEVKAKCYKLAYDFQRKVQTKHFIADATDCLATFLREGIAYAYLIWQVIEGNMTVDMFVLYFGAIGGFSGYLNGIFSIFAELSRHSLGFCKIRAFLEYQENFKYEDGESITYNENDFGKYSLEVKNVSFKYMGAADYILENVNLKIEAGEKLAIVGLNGAGKTTLVKLLCGFYDPTEGEILLNGKDIKIYNRREYYTLFTSVFQEFSILPWSIAENVAQTELENIDTEKVRKCLELADIIEKVNSLPNKEKSLLVKDVNEDATELSGGETQRLMLARALYKNSPILILDEPTAALDPILEHRLYERYNELSSNKTAVYISHRLASTRFCDRIILLGDKGIMESGTHQELLDLKGKYHELFEIQSKYYKEEVEVI